jgi:uncharacterized glyoxalase superfamily protein PhnB
MSKRKAVLDLIDLVVGDMRASADFYNRLGAEVATGEGTSFHANCQLGNDFTLSLDTEKFAALWNKGWRGRTDTVGRAVLGFKVETRDDVDATYADMTGAGYRGLNPPYDAFWGARYAIIEDPNGIAVGLMSPIDPAKRSGPPDMP